ncbi:MAG: tetratricopeptide repeat protein [Spirochaetales bacterium]|nr:tetratricopeptide repeat protein [Spirochaetales bacterium]
MAPLFGVLKSSGRRALVGCLVFITAACSEPDAEALARYENALQLFNRQNYNAARPILEGVLDEYPGFINARVMLGKIYYYNNDHASAERFFEEAYSEDPYNLNTLLWLSKTQRLIEGKQDEALENINEVVRRDSGNIEAWYIKGLLHQDRGENDQAMAAFSAGAAYGQKLALIHMRLAEIYARARLQEDASTQMLIANALARSPELQERVLAEGQRMGIMFGSENQTESGSEREQVDPGGP